MPPPFSLTPPQRRALEALDWLYDGTENYRRTGRSHVLALSYLRRLLVNPPRYDRDGWLDVEDHVAGSRDCDQRLVHLILALAAEIGFNDVRVHPSGTRIRVVPNATVSREVIEALTRFGERSEDDQQPPPPPFSRMRNLPARPNQPDPVTLWDHLEND